MINEENLWAVIYANVLGIRLHPKNDPKGPGPDLMAHHIEDQISIALMTADRAIKARSRQ